MNDQNKSDESLINNFRDFVYNLNSSLQALDDKYKDLSAKLCKEYGNFNAYLASIKKLGDEKDKEIMDLIQQSNYDLFDLIGVDCPDDKQDPLSAALMMDLGADDVPFVAYTACIRDYTGNSEVSVPKVSKTPEARIIEEPIEISMREFDGTTKKLVDGKWVPFEFKEPELPAESSASIDDETVLPLDKRYLERGCRYRMIWGWQSLCRDYFNALCEKIEFLGYEYSEGVECYIKDPSSIPDKEWEALKSLIAKTQDDVTILHKEITMRDPDNTKIATTDAGARLIKEYFGGGFTC